MVKVPTLTVDVVVKVRRAHPPAAEVVATGVLVALSMFVAYFAPTHGWGRTIAIIGSTCWFVVSFGPAGRAYRILRDGHL